MHWLAKSNFELANISRIIGISSSELASLNAILKLIFGTIDAFVNWSQFSFASERFVSLRLVYLSLKESLESVRKLEMNVLLIKSGFAVAAAAAAALSSMLTKVLGSFFARKVFVWSVDHLIFQQTSFYVS